MKRKKIFHLSIIFVLFYSQVVIGQKYVALTFDDGPDSSYTEKILDILKAEDVKATFFVLGYKIKKYPQILKRINAEGHLIENHSSTHKNFTEYSDSLSLIKDVKNVDSLIEKIVDKKPRFIRPPYGAIRDDQINLLQRNGYKIAMWTFSTRDWDVFKTTKEDIINSVKENIHNNAIILLHSKDASGKLSDYPLRDNTLEALPKIIEFLKKNNYQFVTFDKINRAGDRASIEKEIKNRDDIIFFGGFEEHFNDAFWRTRWGIPWSSRINDCEIIYNKERAGKILRVNYPKGGIGPQETGLQFPIVFRDMPGQEKEYYNEAYLRYYVKFEKGFDFRKGGKLPGLMGGGDSWTRSGGNQPDGTNGWTLRFMWLTEGKLIVYAYVPKSKNQKWGNEIWGQGINCNLKFETDKWYCIEQYVNVGTPGKDNGKLKVWVNGEEKVNINDMLFWNIENNNGKIGGIYFSTFHGGNTKDWAPNNYSYSEFDGFVVSKNRIGE